VLRIALPNKGRLADETRELFADAGLNVRVRGERALTASLGDAFAALFVRAQDIPEFVADGAADAGVTGWDLVQETGRPLDSLLDLGFGRCRLVVAAREDAGIGSLDDIAAGARIASPFPRLAARFFERRGLPVEIVPLSGAAEVAPHLGIADVVVDLTSTGSTLRVNGLRELATVMASTARLVSRPRADADLTPGARRAPAASPSGAPAAVAAADPIPAARQLDELIIALGSVLRGRSQRYLMANVPRGRLARVKEVLPGLNGPTVVDILNGGDYVAVHAVVAAAAVYRTIADLKALGAEGILVTRIERLMP
jgi:ATP phosphoribosyltransferase